MTVERERIAGFGRLEDGLRQAERLVPVGSLCQRAPVGDGPRGLQRGRRGLELPAARPRPVPGLPLGRGRPGRVLRHRAAAVPGAGAVERPGPDPQGACLRADRARRATTARTSRSTGGTSTPCPAMPGTAGATTTRRPRSPTRTCVAENGRREQVRPRVRAARHRRLRPGPLLDHRGPLRQGRPRRPADGDHRSPTPAPTPTPLHVLPTAWFRNTWSWDFGRPQAGAGRRPAPRRSASSTRSSASWS